MGCQTGTVVFPTELQFCWLLTPTRRSLGNGKRRLDKTRHGLGNNLHALGNIRHGLGNVRRGLGNIRHGLGNVRHSLQLQTWSQLQTETRNRDGNFPHTTAKRSWRISQPRGLPAICRACIRFRARGVPPMLSTAAR
jgi:hypothetical protein